MRTIRCLLETAKIGGWLPVEPTMLLDGYLSSIPWSWGKGEGLDVESITIGQWVNHSCLCNEITIETSEDGIQRVSGLVDMWKCRESGMLEMGMVALYSFTPRMPYASLPSSYFWVMS